jgi:hypothetical protein
MLEFRPAKQLAFVIVFPAIHLGPQPSVHATTALPGATSLELLILFDLT